jgi:DNA replication protein DnaC
LKFFPIVIIDYFCFHDTDLIQEGETFVESEKRVATITYYIKGKQAESGVKLLWGTSTPRLHQKKAGIICFDDLGTESNLKYFGNECNVMGEILLSRYDAFTHPELSKRLKTHLTTNLSASEIEQFYGNRIRSRLRESFNLIAFNNNSKDKRS